MTIVVGWGVKLQIKQTSKHVSVTDVKVRQVHLRRREQGKGTVFH